MSSIATVRRQPMGSAERFFQRSLYLLLVTGFAALAGTGKLDFLSVVIGGSALVIRGYYLLTKRRSFVIPERWTSYLTLLYLAFYALDYFLLSMGFVAATVHMVLFIMVMKIFSVQRDRDLLYLALLAFMMVLAAAVLTVDTMFLLTFCFFLLMAMATFVSMEMRRSEREAGFIRPSADKEMRPVHTEAGFLRAAPGNERRFHRSLAFTTVLLAVSSMAGAVVFFFGMPRMEARGYLRNMGMQSELMTGFSDTVSLGGIGRIQQSNAVAIHVQVLSGVLPADAKWRGITLANFDGRRWSKALPESATTYPVRNTRLDLTTAIVKGLPLYAGVAPGLRKPTLRYRVIMEPIGTPVLFLADRPLSVSGISGEVILSADGSVTNAEPHGTLATYSGESDVREPVVLMSKSDSHDYPAAITEAYLQVPDRLDHRIPDLARKITVSATSNYARARTIETYLKQNLGYTLELPGTQADPLANFLFVRKKGHCEYFASSMAIMLRTLGIPSRVVNGFRGGKYNDLNQTYIIRARDAHSWVEVYFPEYGWIAFDPTPGQGDEGSNDAWSRIGLYMDVARELWREWVINYDFTHQIRLSAELASQSNSMQRKLQNWSWHNYRRLIGKLKRFQGADVSSSEVSGIIALIVLLASLPFLPKAWKFVKHARAVRDPERSPGTAASFWYTRMLKLMARRGIAKSPAQTPTEFASSIIDAAMKKDVVVFTETYERARFADSVEDAQRLPELFEELAEKSSN